MSTLKCLFSFLPPCPQTSCRFTGGWGEVGEKCEIKNAGGKRRKSFSMDELGLNSAFLGENLLESFTDTLYSEMLSSISWMI